VRNDSWLSTISAAVDKFRLPIVGIWILVVLGLNLYAPSPERMVVEHGRPILPSNTVSGQAMQRIGKAFGESSSNNESVLIVEKNKPFDDNDRQFRRELLHKLVADKKSVESAFDTWSDPQAIAVSESPDKQLAFVQLHLAGDLGTPTAFESVNEVKSIIDSVKKPDGTAIYLTGLSQGAFDQIQSVMHDVAVIGTLCVILVGTLLFLIYRSMFIALLPLFTFGLAIGAATPTVSLLIQADLLPSSMFTNALMSALMLGAGTDYSIFFIGRYQEGRRNGLDTSEAFTAAYRGIVPVIVASGLTVAGGLACMNLTQLDLFKTIGLPCAIGMLFAVASALTVTPAVLLIGAQRFGLFEPRKRARSATLWRRMGIRIARWPVPIFVATTAVLVLFMLAIPTGQLNYDELDFVPKNVPSSRGLSAAKKHFPLSQMSPDVILVEADHDLRNSADIGLLERAAQTVSKMPDVNAVQWITRPLGVPLDQASLTYGVSYAGSLISQNTIIIDERVEQMRQLTDNLGQLIPQIDGVQAQLANAHQDMQQFSAASAQIQDTLRGLNDRVNHFNAQIGQVRELVDVQSNCVTESLCTQVKTALNYFDSISRINVPIQQLTRKFTSIGENLSQSTESIPLVKSSLIEMHDMAVSMNSAMSQVMVLLNSVTQLMHDFAKSNSGTGDYFYFPAQILNDPSFKPYIHLMFSPNGKATRMIVMGKSDSFSAGGMIRARRLSPTMEAALKGTRLQGSTVSIGGAGAMMSDMHAILVHDEKLILVSALTLIFTIILIMLGSLTAAFVVVSSVVLSFASTLGLSLLIWQHLLGTQLHWSVPVAVFAILISVGADYNLLIASRFKEEMVAGVRTGVIRSVAGSGGVVTTAGMVFAVTMFSMLGATLLNVAQMGATIGLGLIIDTFIVRTFTVPTLAVMLGNKFWWPVSRTASPHDHSGQV